MSNGTPVMNFHGSHAKPNDLGLAIEMLRKRADKWRRDALTFEPGTNKSLHANTYARALEDSADALQNKEFLNRD